MLENTAQRAYIAYSADRWAALNIAHIHLLRGQVRSALSEFRAALRGLVDLIGGEFGSWPLLSDDPSDASVSSALICLRDFYYLTNTWNSWPLFAEPVRTSAQYSRLSAGVRAHIEAGWAYAHLAHRTPQLIIGDLERALAEVGDDSSDLGRWARVSLHLALAKAYNLILETDVAADHASAAIALNDEAVAPFYTIAAYHELANAHYDAATLNGDDPARFALAAESYDRVDAIVNRIGPEAWPMSCDYDRGWMFCRLGQFESAVEYFERAAFQRTGSNGLFYDAGRCHYGLGYALLKLRQHAAARKSLQRAVDLFSDDDHVQMNQDALGAGTRSTRMMAVSLQILGLIEQDDGNLQDALEYLELSRDHLTTVTNPASWYDTLMPLIEVCRALGNQERVATYQAELDDLRKRFPAIKD
jgi:tetratricopeptide (TPR) repeat protein